jgi:G3E family GTPase
MSAPIPVHLLTGFLGSGKTTLLRHLLMHPDMGRTAVVVNEFGEVGIDHDLLATSDDNFVQLSNGCLCCRIGGDLSRTLDELARRSAPDGRIDFQRVVIETSGLADPVPIVASLLKDTQARMHFRLAGVVTTVDAVLGLDALARYAESARQVGVADCIVVTKTDRPDARAAEVQAAIAQMRPGIPVLLGDRGGLAPRELFGACERSGDGSWNPATLPAGGMGALRPASVHSSGIGSVSIVREKPLRAATLPLFLSAMAAQYGADLLRLKGIVGIAERPAQPAVVHGVQHLYETAGWLPAWPGEDRSTRIVCIGRNLHAEWIGMLLDLLDEEVVAQAAVTRAADQGSGGEDGF